MINKRPSAAKLHKMAKVLAVDIIGGIQYGDSRDNPKWKKRVLEAATGLIEKQFILITK